MRKNNDYANISIYELFEEEKEEKEKRYKYKTSEYREYIKNNFKTNYYNELFFTILLDSEFSVPDDVKWSVTPEEQLVYFTKLYNTFTYHLDNEYIQIFSIRHDYYNGPFEYSVFVNVKEAPYIVEFPRVKNDILNGVMCAPACAIWWYNKDGTRANDYLSYKNETDKEEFLNLDIRFPKQTKDCSFSEWYKDYREYFFFKYLKLHKWAHDCRVSDFKYDLFSNYSWTLLEMTYYFETKNEF